MAEIASMEFAICVATFYEDLAERLVNGAVEAFGEEGVAPTSVQTYEVPGAFELPLAARWCAESGRFAGIACLGVVIRGETNHYDYVCAEAARGIQRVQLDTGVPCAFGVRPRNTLSKALFSTLVSFSMSKFCRSATPLQKTLKTRLPTPVLPGLLGPKLVSANFSVALYRPGAGTGIEYENCPHRSLL